MKPALIVFYQLVAKTIAVTSSKHLTVIFVGVLALVGCTIMGLWLGIRQPQSHDEFSYLLAADTFAHGRLTNPAHPMWVHFDTLHVIQQPSYMSKFMPAQGFVLMLGKILGGHPIVGVWFSMALMCGAICWMLQGWLPTRWAFLGGIFAVIHPNIGVGNYWAQSYWGGALPAAGGALLLGGVRRLMEQPRTSSAVAAGLGLALLANSRPYEGLVLSVPVGVVLITRLLGKNRPPTRILIHSILVPFALIGVLTVGVMAYYNYRITGSVSQIPYLLHTQQYMIAPIFVWQTPSPKPVYRHQLIEDFHLRFELPYYFAKHSFAGFLKINSLALAYHIALVGSVFAISLIGSAKQLLSWAWNDFWGRCALCIYGVFICGLMIETYSLPHYWAPITALSYLFLLQGLRLWGMRNPRVGQSVLLALPFLALAILIMTTYHLVATHDEFMPPQQRARLLQRLSHDEDRHLILVRYGPHHSYFMEWVYNEADVDASKVVWARAMNFHEDCKLMAYFKDRKIWSLVIDHDEAPVRLEAIPTKSCR
jgi:hypothetical protein